VWFGEEVPTIEQAQEIVKQADILIIIGTSLQVYPAAGLVNYAKPNIPIYLIDPQKISNAPENITIIQKGASEGMKILEEILLT
jgi:NAD-dependent deacetylase